MLLSERRVKYRKWERALAVIVFSAFFLEAYLNWIGAELFTENFENFERKAPLDKLDEVRKTIGIHFSPQSSELDAFRQLFALRDALAHGRSKPTQRLVKPTRLTPAQISSIGDPPWITAIQSGRFREYFAHAKSLVLALHAAHRPGEDPFALLKSQRT
jgi:hypothetical protein